MADHGANSSHYDLKDILNVVWLIGLSISIIGLLLQILLYVVIPHSRKLDQKILTQLTVTRIINTICEYFVFNAPPLHPIARDFVFALYLQSDTVLICWMFVFTKNLYDKVFLVFGLQKCNFGLVSALIWFLTLPVGMICPYLLYNQYFEIFKIFYKVYAICKFIVLIVNIICFCRVYRVALNRGRKNERNLKNIIRICVVSLTLLCITSLQVLITDFLSFFGQKETVTQIFCVINSFQVVAFTMIFIALVNSGCEESLLTTITAKAAARWPGCFGK